MTKISRVEPFRFCTQLHVEELTGLRAATIPQLIQAMHKLPGSAIYYHTHQYLQQHQLVVPEPSNDFANWVRQALDETELAEQLATIDTVHFQTIRSLRRKLIDILERYIASRPVARMTFARPGEEFHAIKTVSVMLGTPYTARTLQEFREALTHVTVQSLYFHLFEARLRLARETNDFSAWFHDELGETALARTFDSFNPYSVTLEGLRSQLLALLDRHMQSGTQRTCV